MSDMDTATTDKAPAGYRSLRDPLSSNRRYRKVLWHERFNWLMLTLFALFSPVVLALIIGYVQHIPMPFSLSLPSLF